MEHAFWGAKMSTTTTTGHRFTDIDDRTEALKGLADEHPDLWKDFLHRYELSWIYHENALEGIVVTHAELNAALKGRPIALDTYPAIRNAKTAINFIRKEAMSVRGPVGMPLATKLHDAFCSGDGNGTAGRYRKIIPLHRTYFHDIAQPHHIEPRFNKLMNWATANDPQDEDVVKFAAHLHHEFMSIFPYAENTGKTGRLLVNYLLMRTGYLPVVLHASERQRYYDTLRHSAKDTEQFLLEMMANCIDNGRTFIKKALEEREKQKVRRLAAV